MDNRISSNTYYWFIDNYRNNKQNMINQYLNDEIKADVEANINESNINTRLIMEAKYIWVNYIRSNDILKDKMRNIYRIERDNYYNKH